MNSRSRPWLYYATLWGAVIGGALLTGLALRADPVPAFPRLALFAVLCLVTESGRLTLPFAGFVSFGVVASLPAILVVGSGYAGLFAGFGQLVSSLRLRRPIATVIFNPFQKTLCVVLAGAAWNLVESGRPSLGPVHPALHPDRVLPAALLCGAVYTVATHIVVSLFSATRRGLPVGTVLVGNAPTRVAAIAALGSLGLLAAFVALQIRTEPPNLQYLLGILTLGGFAFLAWDFHQQTSRVQRAAFEQRLERAIGQQTALSVVSVRIEPAEDFGDGRLRDQALRQVARVLALEHRAHVDVVVRHGASELVALLPQTGKTEAAAVAARIRAIVDGVLPARPPAGTANPPAPRLTVRLGMASFPEDGRTIEALIAAAGRAMHELGDGAGGAAPA